MLFAEEHWGYYGQGQLNEQTRKMLADLAEEVLEELDLDCAVLDVFRPDGSQDEWCLDFSGNRGVICIDTAGAHSAAQIKDRIRSRLLERARDPPRRRAS